MIYIGNTYMGQASIGGGGGLEPLIPPTSDRNYLYFQAEEDDCEIWLTAPSSFNVSFQYSTDGTTWNTWNYTGNKTFNKLSMPNRGDYVFIRATNTNTWSASSSNYMRFYSNSSKFRAGGNIMSLYSSTLATTSVGNYGFYQLFYGCVYMTGAPELGATTLGNYCYYNMFYGCTGLKTGPSVLPATTLTYYCYYQMFYNCSSLIAAPEISATAFSSTNSCYNMFYGCSSMTTPPTTLWSTTLTQYCYSNMFYGCTSLTTAPELPATTLAYACYENMFYGCASLTTAPTLPATTLAQYCYSNMFYGCSSMTTPPTVLPATTLQPYCYYNMFYGCTSLTTAPELPATTLTSSCYQGMFYGCTSLTTAPTLPAETLVNFCYYQMFYGCSHLNYVKSLNKNNNTSWTGNWLSGVSSTGTFVKAAENTGWSRNANGIPSTWNVVDNIDYFSINNTYSGTNTFTLTKTGSPTSASSIQYSTDSNTWSNVSWSGSTFTHPIPQGGKIYLRSNSGFSTSETDYFTINVSNSFSFGGNILTINDYEHVGSATVSSYVFFKLFENCTTLTTAPRLLATTLCVYCYGEMFSGCTGMTTPPTTLPATSLAGYCYIGMFRGCTSLTTAPSLPATTMQLSCYGGMFDGCTNLTTPPSLPATTLANYCYDSMFAGCSSLTTAPALPATVLMEGCYSKMFMGCTSLTKSQTLAVQTLVTHCYDMMFFECSSLNEITCYATNATSNIYTNNWVYGVAVSGTFKSMTGSTWSSGTHGIPVGWTEESSAFLSFSSLTNSFYPTLVVGNTNTPEWEGEPHCDKYIDLEYSFDGSTWTTCDRTFYDYYQFWRWGMESYHCYIFYYEFPQVTPGQILYVRGNNINNSEFYFNYDWMGFKFTEYDFIGCVSNAGFEDDFIYPSYYNLASNITCLGDITSLLNQVGGDVNLSTISANWRTFSYIFNEQGIVTAPNLPSKILGDECYSYMFYDCSTLSYIKVGATSWNTSDAESWVSGVSSSGTFTKPSSTSIPTGDFSGIPTGWTVNNV